MKTLMNIPIKLFLALLGLAGAFAYAPSALAWESIWGHLLENDNNLARLKQQLAGGANPNAPVAGRGNNDQTPLHIAARACALGNLEALLDAGGNPRIATRQGVTPLHLSAGDPHQFGELINAVRMTVPGQDESTRRKCTNGVGLLLRHGANPNHSDLNGETPVHWAARATWHRFNEAQHMEALLRAGGNPNLANLKGEAPLHVAMTHGDGSPYHAGKVRALLKAGAESDAVNGEGLTPLMVWAANSVDDGEPVVLLLQAGASPDRKSPEGDAPLHMALRPSERFEVVEALLAGRADPCVQNAWGYIPYNMAKEGGPSHQALGRAHGHDRACDLKRSEEEETEQLAEQSLEQGASEWEDSGPVWEDDSSWNDESGGEHEWFASNEDAWGGSEVNEGAGDPLEDGSSWNDESGDGYEWFASNEGAWGGSEAGEEAGDPYDAALRQLSGDQQGPSDMAYAPNSVDSYKKALAERERAEREEAERQARAEARRRETERQQVEQNAVTTRGQCDNVCSKLISRCEAENEKLQDNMSPNSSMLQNNKNVANIVQIGLDVVDACIKIAPPHCLQDFYFQDLRRDRVELVETQRPAIENARKLGAGSNWKPTARCQAALKVLGGP